MFGEVEVSYRLRCLCAKLLFFYVLLKIDYWELLLTALGTTALCLLDIRQVLIEYLILCSPTCSFKWLKFKFTNKACTLPTACFPFWSRPLGRLVFSFHHSVSRGGHLGNVSFCSYDNLIQNLPFCPVYHTITYSAVNLLTILSWNTPIPIGSGLIGRIHLFLTDLTLNTIATALFAPTLLWVSMWPYKTSPVVYFNALGSCKVLVSFHPIERRLRDPHCILLLKSESCD